MLTTRQVQKAIEAAQAPGYTVVGGVESGQVRITYTRPNGIQLGTGFNDYAQVFIKRARKWDAYRI